MNPTTYVSSGVLKPLDLIENCIGKRVFIKCRNNRQMTGILHVDFR